MIPKNRPEFEEYCLRQLGAPVLQINISPEQKEDSIDKAILWIQRTGMYGAEKTYFIHQLNQNDLDNGYVIAPPNITHMVEAFGLNGGGLAGIALLGGGVSVPGFGFISGSGSAWSFAGSSAITNQLGYGLQLQQYASEMQAASSMRSRPVRFNNHTMKVFIDAAANQFSLGMFIMIEAYAMIDPAQYNHFWQDQYLERYCVSVMKHRWGSNLSKFDNMTLPGGVQFNGKGIKDEATEELKQLDAELLSGRWGGLPNVRFG